MPFPSPPTRLPLATYRVQFNRDFTFNGAAEIVPYLRELGISDLYASPIFQAAPESTHGYDVCSFTKLNSALGTETDFHRLASTLRNSGMGLLLDMVPNHMGADLSNLWWRDVLEKGRSSSFAEWFDIDWEPPGSEFRNRVLVPVLEERVGAVVRSGKLRFGYHDEHGLGIAYYSNLFPASADTYYEFLRELLPTLPSAVRQFQDLPWESPPPVVMEVLKQALLELAAVRDNRSAVEALISRWNDQDHGCWQRLFAALQQQHYRLAYWRVGPEEINYRRFFDITQLISLRVEEPSVFAGSHQFLLELINRGDVTAVRVDHPDGLWNPQEYCARLQAACNRPIYVVVEKILTGEEELPLDWPVHGTTGYDFLNLVNGLFVESENEERFDSLYRQQAHHESDFQALVYESKQNVLAKSFLSEIDRLTHRLQRLARDWPAGSDFTFREMRAAITAFVAAFPVYRTYITSQLEVSAVDREHIAIARRIAGRRSPDIDPALLLLLEQVLNLEVDMQPPTTRQLVFEEFVGRFQQLTGAIMAKGLEDTSFYNYNRFISLNEVGGSPERFGSSVEEFHEKLLRRAQRFPDSLLATATHDTKRGEDLRARLNVLSEMPGPWSEALKRWREINASLKSRVDNYSAPDPNDEYLFYQSLVGSWTDAAAEPAGLQTLRERLAKYMLKAIKESKRHTSWTDVNTAYEDATRSFIEQSLDKPNGRFLTDVQSFHRPVAFFGHINALAQVILKICSPGVPDFYQGTELLDFSLVDPDNRRPVDYASRREMLREIQSGCAAPEGLPRTAALSLQEWPSGMAKLFVTWAALQLRASFQTVFQRGRYVPLVLTGRSARHGCAFARVQGDNAIVVLVPRFLFSLVGELRSFPLPAAAWSDTTINLCTFRGHTMTHWFTGQQLELHGEMPVGELFRDFPVVLLASSPRRA